MPVGSDLKFGFAAIFYILFIIWLGNYWYLFGLLIIFDIYVSKKVNWTFWKKLEGKNSSFIEWFDALIFAVIAVTLIHIFLFQNYKIPSPSMEKSLLVGDRLYVSKLAYGPRVPQTPLSFPFAQHTLPLTKKPKSYLEWIKLDYKRLKGFGKIKRDDVVVFNFPADDTIVLQMSEQDYESILCNYAEQFKQVDVQQNSPVKTDEVYHSQAKNYVWDNYDIAARPVDRRDNYIKRCVAIPVDTLEIRDRKLFVNCKPQKEIENIQYGYLIKTNQTFNHKTLEKLDITSFDIRGKSSSLNRFLLTDKKVNKIMEFVNVDDIQPSIEPKGEFSINIFPHDARYPWNIDNFEPLYIPEKGTTVELTLDVLPLIHVYGDLFLKII